MTVKCCCGVGFLSPQTYVQVLTPVPMNVTCMGSGVFEDVML